MQPNQPQPQPKKYLEIKPEHLARVQAAQDKASDEIKVDNEWLLIAEFGKHYGWQAMQAVLNNEIDLETMTVLILGARKFDYSRQYANAQASFIGSASAQSKKPSKVFKKATEQLIKEMKADS